MSNLVFRGSGIIASGGNFAIRADTSLSICQPRGICPTHGEVDGNFHAYVTSDPDYRTPNICPKCYIDWIAAHVQAVTPVASTSPAQEGQG